MESNKFAQVLSVWALFDLGSRYINFCVSRVQLLRSFNITPVLVFDGGALPSKKGQEEKRRKYLPPLPNLPSFDGEPGPDQTIGLSVMQEAPGRARKGGGVLATRQ
jgi:hypothetical protein